MEKVRLYISDKFPVVRQGIKALFARYPEYVVVGEGDNDPNTLMEVAGLSPDVVIMELPPQMGREIDAADIVMGMLPETKVVVFTMESNCKYVVEMLQAGVMGYVMKDSPSEELVSAVQSVMEGKRHVSPSLSEKLFNDYVLKDKEEMEPFDTLSSREREVLGLIAEGGRAKELAVRLSVSVSTIKKHKSNIMKKLHARGMADLVRVAVSKGVVKDLCM